MSKLEAAGLLVVAAFCCSCIGGRVGYRHHFKRSDVSGVYGGPYITFIAKPFMGTWDLDTHIPRFMFGGEVSSWFGHGLNSGSVAGLSVLSTRKAPIVGTVGVSFGDTTEIEAGVCLPVLPPLDARTCLRGNSAGWAGLDGGLGLNIPFVAGLFAERGESY